MVYSSDFYTTRSYSSRPVVSSYSVSYPISSYSTGKSRVYSISSYPIYSRLPYISSRVISSPVRTVSSSSYYRYRSPSPPPVRTITTTRYIRSTSPISTISTIPYSYTRVYNSPIYTSPVRVITSPLRYITYPTYRPYIASPYYRDISPIRYFRTSPSVLAREYDRIFHKLRPSYGYRPLEEYLNSEAFINFDSETRRIRNDAHSILMDIHSKVQRRARSVTPYYTMDDAPYSHLALKSYVDRITDPTRHLAREIRSLSLAPDYSRKYMGAFSLKELDPNRSSRRFSAPKSLEDPDQDLKDKQRERKERLTAISEDTEKDKM